MNILVDFTQIPLQKVGVGVYARETFKEMLSEGKNQYFFILQDDDTDLISLFKESNEIFVKAFFFRIFFFRFLLEQFYLPWLCLKHRIDIIHSLHYSFPLITFGAKKVVTIHDLTFFIFPELHRTIKRYYFKWFTLLASRFADSLICVSESTKNDLMKYIKCVYAKQTVVPLSASPVIVPKNEELSSIKSKYQIRSNYILFIGTLEPRKNITNLIKAFSLDKEFINGFQLVIVGRKGWFYESIFSIVKELKLEDSVLFTGFISTREKYILLSGASAFVYPSIYEGFGLPVLEAINYKIPSVTSNISSLPEVAGDAAVLVNPLDVQELHDAIASVLFDDEVRRRLQYNARIVSDKFSWSLTSQKTLGVYGMVCSK